MRTDVPGFKVTSVSAPTFMNPGTITSPLFGQNSLQRGYVLVDATLDGLPFQFVSTHLDGGLIRQRSPPRPSEILKALGTTGRASTGCRRLQCPPLAIYVSGCRAVRRKCLQPASPTPAPHSDRTCCQSPNLSNTVSILNREYDYIFESGFSSVDSAALVGNQPFEDVPPLWPSDHAGVVATLTEVPEADRSIAPGTSAIAIRCCKIRRQRRTSP